MQQQQTIATTKPDLQVLPTPFGQKRARELWAERGQAMSFPTISPGEDAYVKSIQDRMGGDSCWMSAFFSIFQGCPIPRIKPGAIPNAPLFC